MDSRLTPHDHASPGIRFQLGAVPVSETQTRFSVWAPKAKTVSVELIRRWGDLEKVLSEQFADKTMPTETGDTLNH